MANPNAAVFPGRAATDADLFVLRDNSVTSVASAIAADDVNIELASAAPFDDPCIIRIEQEIIVCPTPAVVNVFNGVVRGAFGTAAVGHAFGLPVYGFYFAWHHNQLAAELKAIETALKAHAAILNPPNFADNEVPGVTDGTHFTLAHAPNPPASLMLFRVVAGANVLQQPGGTDYTLAADAITSAADWTGSVLQAFYRY